MGFLLSKDERLIPNIGKVRADSVIYDIILPRTPFKISNFRSKGQFTSGTVVLILTIGSLDPGSIPGRVVLQLR